MEGVSGRTVVDSRGAKFCIGWYLDNLGFAWLGAQGTTLQLV